MSERTAMTASIDPTDVQGWDHPGYQQCRKDRSVQASHIAALEAENRALREFVAAWDQSQEPFAVVGYERFRAIKEGRKNALEDARNRLAAEHGLPLPGAGEGA